MPQMKILLVDEDQATRSEVRKLLERGDLRDAAFLEAKDEMEARALLNEAPDLMVTELRFRGSWRTGMQLVSDARMRCPQMPIIAYSSEKTHGISDAATRIGAAVFVPKSSRVPNELEDAVRAYGLAN